MIVGEGRAGKTACYKSFVGETFENTASTMGINKITCSVTQVSAGNENGGIWTRCEGRGKEFEAALARGAQQTKSEHKDQGDDSILDTSLSRPREVNSINNDGIYDAASATALVAPASVPNLPPTPPPPTTTTVAKTTTSPSSLSTSPTFNKSDDTDGYYEGATLKSRSVDRRQFELARSVQTESDLIISVFDYGGQDIFNVIHHLFLTEYGVYVLCFNMEWMSTENEVDRERCLKYLRHWIDNIYMHTCDAKTQKCAPFVLVGTHKDRVSSPKEHHDVDAILHQTFNQSPAWHSLLGNDKGEGRDGRAHFNFFPVDNKKGRSDPAMIHLLLTIEKAIEDAEYTHRKVPLSWLAFIDDIRAKNKSFFELEKFKSVAIEECGVEERHVSLLLKFLHEMGMCMYNDVPSLNDLVIMDAIEYLVVPASMVICNHRGDGDDNTRHVLPRHVMEAATQPANRKKWNDLTNRGILAKSLLHALWLDRLSELDRLVSLMTQYGLVVPLVSSNELNQQNEKHYLIPSLLPQCKDINLNNTDGKWGDEVDTYSCYFFFTLTTGLENKVILDKEDLIDNGFCPSGLYERVLGKIITWAQSTSKDGRWDPDSVALYKMVSILSFGSRFFRITNVPRLNSLRIDIQGSNPLLIVQIIHDLIKEVMSECMKGLSELVLLPKIDGGSMVDYVDAINALENTNGSSSSLIPLQQMKHARDDSGGLKYKGKKIFSSEQIISNYAPWLQVYDQKEQYDLFISYRWSQYDKPIARRIFDSMSNHRLHRRIVDVFLDVFRLREGQRFDEEFATALIKSSVVMPLFSMGAFEKMKTHDAKLPDNVLLEWIIAHECLEARKKGDTISRITSIYPILFGKRTKVAVTGEIHVDPINWGQLTGQLPDVAPTATIIKVKEILKANGITTISDKLDTYTVRSFVCDTFCTYQGMLAWEKDPYRLVSEIAAKANELIATIEVTPATSPTEPRNLKQQSSGSNFADRSRPEIESNRYDEAWSILCNASKSNDFEGLQKYLDDQGIEKAYLPTLDAEQHETISRYLKPIPKRVYLGIVLPP